MSATMPLFGDENSVFKMTQEELCNHIVETLRSAAKKLEQAFTATPNGNAPYLRSMTKGQLLQQATALRVRVGELIPLEMNASILRAFQEEAERRKVTMIANTGDVSSASENVRIMLQFDAIDDVCDEITISAEDEAKLCKFRKKLQSRLIQ